MIIESQTAIEGEDTTLTCRATRYLYSKLQWFDGQNRTLSANVSVVRLGPYSVSLALTLRNVSRGSSMPLYRCTAHDNVSGKLVHKTIRLNVSGKRGSQRGALNTASHGDAEESS